MKTKYKVTDEWRTDFAITFSIDDDYDFSECPQCDLVAFMRDVYAVHFTTDEINRVFEQDDWQEEVLKHLTSMIFHNCNFGDGWENASIARDEMKYVDGPTYGENEVINIVKVEFEGVSSSNLVVDKIL